MYLTEEVRELKSEIMKLARPQILLGLLIFVILFFGLGSWSVIARIDKAALALGEVIPSGNKQVIQHLEGGIIKELHVNEGDKVEKNQVLVTLSKTSASANKEIVETTMNAALAEYYRLVAERKEQNSISFPKEWQRKENAHKYQEYIDSQTQVFNERRKSYKGRVSILKERSNQLGSEIKGLQSQISSARTQLEYTDREMAVVERLLATGNTTMARLLALKSRKAEIEGRVGELRASVSRAKQAISENKLSIINQKNEMINEVTEKIKELQATINEYKERKTAATDTLERTEIRASISGIIKDLKFKTEAGVIPPGAEIMTIIPQDEGFLAEVKISPIDIDIVHPGLKSRVRLSSYSARHIPMLNGELTFVSADTLLDEATGENYYKGKVKIDISKMNEYLQEEKDENMILYPGMPVEVYITTGLRSPLSYLIDPITQTFRRSFLEE